MQDAVVIGGLEMQQQARALAKRPHVVVATPGRLRVGFFTPHVRRPHQRTNLHRIGLCALSLMLPALILPSMKE